MATVSFILYLHICSTRRIAEMIQKPDPSVLFQCASTQISKPRLWMISSERKKGFTFPHLNSELMSCETTFDRWHLTPAVPRKKV